MTTIVILTILIPAVTATMLIVYRSERRTAHLSRVPFHVASTRHGSRRKSTVGPDADRIDMELDTLLLLRRDGG